MRILTDIINADGRIGERETLLFGKLRKDFNLSEKDHKVALEKNSFLTLVQIKNLNEEIETQNQILKEKEQSIKNLNEELITVYMSKSWKITRPLRSFMRKLRKR